jgi:hypothetical protein
VWALPSPVQWALGHGRKVRGRSRTSLFTGGIHLSSIWSESAWTFLWPQPQAVSTPDLPSSGDAYPSNNHGGRQVTSDTLIQSVSQVLASWVCHYELSSVELQALLLKSGSAATDPDLTSFLKAIPDERTHRAIRI